MSNLLVNCAKLRELFNETIKIIISELKPDYFAYSTQKLEIDCVCEKLYEMKSCDEFKKSLAV